MFAVFGSAKAALRSVAQHIALEFGPKGIHVGHIVIDGLVNGERVNKFGYGLGYLFRKLKGRNGSLLPDAIAENYWQVYLQPPTAWVHELDLRPFREKY